MITVIDRIEPNLIINCRLQTLSRQFLFSNSSRNHPPSHSIRESRIQFLSSLRPLSVVAGNYACTSSRIFSSSLSMPQPNLVEKFSRRTTLRRIWRSSINPQGLVHWTRGERAAKVYLSDSFPTGGIACPSDLKPFPKRFFARRVSCPSTPQLVRALHLVVCGSSMHMQVRLPALPL